MIGEGSSFHNFFPRSALFQRISWDDSINSIDWSALSSFQTTSTDDFISISFSNNGEINSEMMKSNQVQPTISIHEDGQRIDGSALAVSINGDDEINLGMMMKSNEVQPNISTDLFSDSALFRTASTVDSISIDCSALDVSNNGDDEINSGMMKRNQVQPNISTDGDGGCYTFTRRRRRRRCIYVAVSQSTFKRLCRLFTSWSQLYSKDDPFQSLEMGWCLNDDAPFQSLEIGGCWNSDAPFQSLEIDGCWNADAPFQSLEIDRCSNTDAIENNLIQSVESGQCFNGDIFPWATSTPAKYIPLGEIANTAMGNDEMDQGNNIFAVMEAVTNGDYVIDVITHDDIPIEDDCSMKIYNETLEKINQLRGTMPQREAAKKLDVSLSTLKRRCKELGLGRWPYSKRKNGLIPSARLKKNKSVEIGQCSNADTIEDEAAVAMSIPLVNISMGNDVVTASHENEAAISNSSPTSTNGNVLATGNEEIGHSVNNNARNIVAAAVNHVPMNEGEAVTTGKDTIVVSATYKDDTIEFPLCCSSGIEELRKELDAFETKDEKYKIKYEREDGQWITLLRDTHLSFRIQTLKALGQSNLALSVFDSVIS